MTYDLAYICEIIQRGHIKPAKYRHYISMDRDMYEFLRIKGVIVPEQYFVEQSAFFQYNKQDVTINFINIKHINDIHIRILSYLVSEHYGFNPLTRGGTLF